MAVGAEKLMVLAPEAVSQKALSNFPQAQVRKALKLGDLKKIHGLFIEVSATALPDVAEIVKRANESKDLRVLFIRADIDAHMLPQMLRRADLKALRNMLVHSPSDWETPKRVLNAWAMGAEHDLIASASAAGDTLHVLSCALDAYEVSFDEIPALKNLSSEKRAFEVEPGGSYIHWPGPDVHLDLDAIRYLTDMDWRIKQDRVRIAHDRRFGRALAKVRQEYGLAQSDITGLSDRQVRRIEKGEARPSIATLEALARAHKMKLDPYLEKIADEMHLK